MKLICRYFDCTFTYYRVLQSATPTYLGTLIKFVYEYFRGLLHIYRRDVKLPTQNKYNKISQNKYNKLSCLLQQVTPWHRGIIGLQTALFLRSRWTNVSLLKSFLQINFKQKNLVDILTFKWSIIFYLPFRTYMTGT